MMGSVVSDLLRGYAIAVAVVSGMVAVYCGLILKGMMENARHPQEEDNDRPH